MARQYNAGFDTYTKQYQAKRLEVIKETLRSYIDIDQEWLAANEHKRSSKNKDRKLKELMFHEDILTLLERITING